MSAHLNADIECDTEGCEETYSTEDADRIESIEEARELASLDGWWYDEETGTDQCDTHAPVQIWLNQRRDKGFRHAAEIRSVNNDYGAQRAAYGWTREAMMAQETLDWIAEGNGNG